MRMLVLRVPCSSLVWFIGNYWFALYACYVLCNLRCLLVTRMDARACKRDKHSGHRIPVAERKGVSSWACSSCCNLCICLATKFDRRCVTIIWRTVKRNHKLMLVFIPLQEGKCSRPRSVFKPRSGRHVSGLRTGLFGFESGSGQ
jgi:hypothetical protein